MLQMGRGTPLRDDSDSEETISAPRGGETLSVVMSVHNALPYLDEAVRSILDQTHRDFEFVIGDDASTDGSTERLHYWAARDDRIRLITRSDNLGPAGSSNWVVGEARGTLIARMDADDVAHPDRFRRQLRVFADHPDAVLTGSPPIGIDRESRVVREQTRWVIALSGFNAPFAHGSIMYRCAAFDRIGGYRLQCEYWEDIDLYLRMASVGRVLVLPDALYFYRFADTSTRLTSPKARVEAAVDLMLRCCACHERGEDYGPLLARAPRDRVLERRSKPLIFLSSTIGRIWSGASPGILGRMLRHASFPRDRESAVVWIIVLWGSISARTLRYVLKIRLRRRNRRMASQFHDGCLYEWRSRAGDAVAAEN